MSWSKCERGLEGIDPGPTHAQRASWHAGLQCGPGKRHNGVPKRGAPFDEVRVNVGLAGQHGVVLEDRDTHSTASPNFALPPLTAFALGIPAHTRLSPS